LDEPLLTEIANIGQGAYYRAVDNKTLEEIFARIDRYEKSEVKESRYKNTRDYYFYYLFWGIVFWLIWLFTKSTFLTNALED
jgi:Ca-activated chloride channel family protein